jgi:outer membrane protein TolC
LTLSEATELALRQSPLVRAAAARVEAATARRAEALSGFLPTLGVQESSTRSNDPVFVFGSLLRQESFGPKNFEVGRLNDPSALTNFRTALELRLPLFDRLRTPTAVSDAGLARAQAEHDRTEVTQRLRFEVVRAYTGVLLAEGQRRVAEEAVRAAEAEVERIADLEARGLVTAADLGAARVQLAEFRQRRIEANGNVATARATLATVLGLDVATPLELVGRLAPPHPELPPLEELLQRALEERPEVRRAAIQVARADQAVQRAFGEYLPQIEARASYGRDGHGLTGGSDSYLVGGFASLRLFDPGRPARLAEARAAREVAEAERRRQVDAVRLEVVRAWEGYRAAKDRARVAARAVGQARETLRIVRDRYEVGLTTITEVLRAETAFVGARTALLAARRDRAVRYAKTLLAAGLLASVEALEGSKR